MNNALEKAWNNENHFLLESGKDYFKKKYLDNTI